MVLSVKLPNLKLKTQPKQLLGCLLLVIALPAYCRFAKCRYDDCRGTKIEGLKMPIG